MIVDDEKDICEILDFNLTGEGFAVDCANSAEEALEKIADGYSLILLDVMMGGMSGYKMAEQLRQRGNNTPIVFLTAKDTENDMLTGFSTGADDYISKPFSVKEVVARVRAVIKRSSRNAGIIQQAENHILEFGDVVINLDMKELTIGRETVTLTKTEYGLLTLLASNPSRIFTREDIIDRLWKDAPYITERTIDVHINRLRKKMGERASMISSRSGYGYRFNVQQ